MGLGYLPREIHTGDCSNHQGFLSLYLKPSHRSWWSNLSPSQPQKLDVSIWKKQLFADALEAEGRRKANCGRFIVLYIMNKVEIKKRSIAVASTFHGSSSTPNIAREVRSVSTNSCQKSCCRACIVIQTYTTYAWSRSDVTRLQGGTYIHIWVASQKQTISVL